MDIGSYHQQALSTAFIPHTWSTMQKYVAFFILFDQFPQFCMPDGKRGNNLKDSCYCPLRQHFAKYITGSAFLSFFLSLFITIRLASYSFDGLLSHMYMSNFCTNTFVHKVASSTLSIYQSTTTWQSVLMKYG